jgi:hypothetical protein
MTTPDSRSLLRFRRVIWRLRKYRWYLRVLGVSRFTREVLPPTTLGRLVFRGKKRSGNSKDTARNSPQLAPPSAYSSQKLMESQAPSVVQKPLDLKPGDWVEVKPAKEILTTLDERGKHRGLTFSQEMLKFCEKRFKVFRVLDKICMETTGELRRMKTPTVILEGVICDGSFHGGCTRSCFHFWREQWLRRSQAPGIEGSKSENA